MIVLRRDTYDRITIMFRIRNDRISYTRYGYTYRIYVIVFRTRNTCNTIDRIV